MKTAEYSANFDIETLETLVQRVSAKWPTMLSPQSSRDFISFVRSLAHDDERPFSFTVEHEGAKQDVTFTVFMDDIDAPDVYFSAFPALIQNIEAEHTALCEELGI